MPGTKIPFTVKEYKTDLALRYSSLVLYLMPYYDENSENYGDDDLLERSVFEK